MSDTIAAIATGGGVSAVGIVRLSGPGAISAADGIFRAKSGIKMTDTADRKLVYGALAGEDGALLDFCLCTVSRAPNSYTGEDTAELHCHGSPVVLAECLRALFWNGVRQAQAGEFTKRAFLNGRMDLSQAEAVIDLIEAETATLAKNAAGQLSGAVSRKVSRVYDALVGLTAHFFAVVDYPDEDIEDFGLQECASVLADCKKELGEMLATADRGRVLKAGLPAAILGKPNAGKSSLLNALVGYERAIVTPIAGTTRDTVEEKLTVGGALLRLVDTAGIRRAADEIESMGVARSLEAAENADLVIAVFDGSRALDENDRTVIGLAAAARTKTAVVNKSDLPLVADVGEIEEALGKAIFVSAVTGDGLGELTAVLGRLCGADKDTPAGELLTNLRQADAIGRARDAILSALGALESGATPDIVLTETESALAALGEVTGRTVRQDIVDRIFERFCVGK